MQISVHTFNAALEKAHSWIKELKEIGNFVDDNQSYSVLRAVLHALRDRLVAAESVDLGAQLPMFIRGFYYEGWNIHAPRREHSKEEFLASIRKELRNAATRIDVESATCAVFSLLENKISNGEIKDVKNMLPPSIRELWE